jgi:hypothetical protein
MEHWTQLSEFPNYSISDHGRVRNDDTGRFMALLVNQMGNVHVGLTKGLTQYKRSVPLLVARTYLPTPPESFDTPVHLDGDTTNNHFENLVWRPRWFAIKYKLQFSNGKRGFRVPIRERETKREFANGWEAATTYGLIDREIMQAVHNLTWVWPTYQVFEVIDS